MYGIAMSVDEVRISMIDGVAVYRWFDGSGYGMSFGYAETTAWLWQCQGMRCVYR